MYRFYSFNNSTTFIKSLTISKLDISNRLSTKKKPYCESNRAFSSEVYIHLHSETIGILVIRVIIGIFVIVYTITKNHGYIF
jgi:uncharacterized membrane protein YkgB